MNNLRTIIDKYNFKINKYTKKGKNYIIDTDKGKFFIKKSNTNKEDLFNYLDTKKFMNYIKPYDNIENKYEIYHYIDDLKVDNEDRAQDIIYLLSILHNKTTFYKGITQDNKKKIYEEHKDKLKNIEKYYEQLKFQIETKTYPSPSEYLLLRNISLIFVSIDSSTYFIEQWYKSVNNSTKQRISRIHGNPALSHIIEKDNPYLISWTKSKNDYPIIDLYHFFQNNYLDVDFSTLFDIYISKYPLLEEEKNLLFAYLLLPQELKLDKSEILNTKETYKTIQYLSKANELVSKHYSKKSN